MATANFSLEELRQEMLRDAASYDDLHSLQNYEEDVSFEYERQEAKSLFEVEWERKKVERLQARDKKRREDLWELWAKYKRLPTVRESQVSESLCASGTSTEQTTYFEDKKRAKSYQPLMLSPAHKPPYRTPVSDENTPAPENTPPPDSPPGMDPLNHHSTHTPTSNQFPTLSKSDIAKNEYVFKSSGDLPPKFYALRCQCCKNQPFRVTGHDDANSAIKAFEMHLGGHDSTSAQSFEGDTLQITRKPPNTLLRKYGHSIINATVTWYDKRIANLQRIEETRDLEVERTQSETDEEDNDDPNDEDFKLRYNTGSSTDDTIEVQPLVNQKSVRRGVKQSLETRLGSTSRRGRDTTTDSRGSKRPREPTSSPSSTKAKKASKLDCTSKVGGKSQEDRSSSRSRFVEDESISRNKAVGGKGQGRRP